jgi:hypothetical protein
MTRTAVLLVTGVLALLWLLPSGLVSGATLAGVAIVVGGVVAGLGWALRSPEHQAVPVRVRRGRR